MKKNYEVVVSGAGIGEETFPVEGWKPKGSSLVPVYDNGMTPQDESPWVTVEVREVTK